MTTCLQATCSASDLAIAKAYSVFVCNSVGVSLVNSATVTGTAFSTLPATPSSSVTGGSESSGSSHLPIGAIVGGAVGGAVVLAAMAIGLFIYIRKTRHKVGPQPEVQQFDTSHGPDPQPQMQSHWQPYTPSTFNAVHTQPSNFSVPSSTPSDYPPDPSDQVSDTTQLVHDMPAFNSMGPPDSHHPPARTAITVESLLLEARSYLPSATIPSGQHATEQLGTPHTLHNHNMPTTQISGLIERRRPEHQVSEDGSRSGSSRGDMRDPPQFVTPHSHSMPTTQIPGVIGRMRTEQEVSEAGSRSGSPHGDVIRGPPSYDTPSVEISDEMERAAGKQQASGEGSSGWVRSGTIRDPPMYDFKD